ncbi:hypothetical protein C1H46_037204 [Malus baccata]|uniref:Uncharacterized protein n=1 Tax=Malus baccata TaxID=106549 RepID=A0A540KSR6_MALBA|nr:hypothetical protein C1H46_037204 [Malus baccata]
MVKIMTPLVCVPLLIMGVVAGILGIQAEIAQNKAALSLLIAGTLLNSVEKIVRLIAPSDSVDRRNLMLLPWFVHHCILRLCQSLHQRRETHTTNTQQPNWTSTSLIVKKLTNFHTE